MTQSLTPANTQETSMQERERDWTLVYRGLSRREAIDAAERLAGGEMRWSYGPRGEVAYPGGSSEPCEVFRASALLLERLKALEAELDQLKADAARYRWLRDTGCNIYGDTTAVPIPQNDGSYKDVLAPMIRAGETLDAAIDAARTASEKKA
jgi:hypothetical protein